jgi:hypothetical protein
MIRVIVTTTISNSISKSWGPGAEPRYRAIEKEGCSICLGGSSACSCMRGANTVSRSSGSPKDNSHTYAKTIEERYGRQISAVRKH